MAKLQVLQGPNLNLLGTREPEIYGTTTLEDIHQNLMAQAEKAGHQMSCLQSNAEHVLIDRIHACQSENIDFILLNPAAFTHTSVALRDALLAVDIPFIEIHLSNIFAREEFRTHSFFSDIAEAVITGAGALSYELALQTAIKLMETK